MIAAIFEIDVGFFAGMVIGILIGFYIAWKRRKSGKYGGTIKITETATGKIFSLELNSQPEELENHKTVTFKIEPPPKETPE